MHLLLSAIIIWPWKIAPVSVGYLFYQPMDEKIKTWTLYFPAKENPNMEKELFNWPIVLQYDLKAKYWLFSRKFSGMKFFHPSVRLTNQKPRAFDLFNKRIKSLYFHSFVVCVLFLRIFILTSYENHSIKFIAFNEWLVFKRSSTFKLGWTFVWEEFPQFQDK